MSNIARSNRFLKKTAAHEATHLSERFLTDITHLPRLPTFSYNTHYYVPNAEHPVANKYSSAFMSKKRAHAKSPEEHWANYMG